MFLLLASVLTPSLGLDNFGYVLLIVAVVAVVVVVAVVSVVAVVVAACKGFAMRVELSWGGLFVQGEGNVPALGVSADPLSWS